MKEKAIIFYEKNVCRGCLSECERLHDMFQTSTDEMFTFCTSIQVCKEDRWSISLCSPCFEATNNFYKFKTMCLESNVKLIQNIKDKATYSFNENISDLEEHKNNEIFAYFKDEFFPPEISLKGELTKLKLKKEKRTKDSQLPFIQQGNLSNGSRLIYKCERCEEELPSLKSFEKHKKAHEKQVPIKCTICNKVFKQQGGLRRHTEFVHMTTDKKLKCPTCGKLYKTVMTLKNHQKLHQERKSFVCYICGRAFKSPSGFETHVETHKENREKKYECKICKKTFVSSKYLSTHMFIHKGKRFVCKICGFPFIKNTDLARHTLSHNGIKPYICTICNKGYSTKFFLLEHGRIHCGEKPYGCDICPMSFVSKRRLIDHHRTHTGERPYKCDKCDQAFTQRGSLKRHFTVHEKH